MTYTKSLLVFLFLIFSVQLNEASYEFRLNVVYNNPGSIIESLYLRGDALGLNWNKGVKLEQDSSTSWIIVLSVNSTSPKTLEVKPLVRDNIWSIGSNFIIDLTSQFSAVTIYPWFYTSSGTYSILGDLYSPQLDNVRSIIVYYPPSYYENIAKVQTNVLIMHDGQNLFNASTSYAGAWYCDKTIDQQVVQGNIEEVIIIGVYNTPDRIDEYTYSYDPCYDTTIKGDCIGGGGKGDLYLDFIVENVIPFAIQKGLRIMTNKENLGIMGSSLGGLISCYAGYTRSSVFGKTGCMSSSFWWNTEDFNNVIMKTYIPPKNPDESQFYLDSGTCCPNPIGDDSRETQSVLDSFQGLGWTLDQNLWYYLDVGADHEEYYWGKRFHISMQDFYSVKPSNN